jgi:hypothetical protein
MPGGETAVHEVVLAHLTPVAAVLPNLIAVAPDVLEKPLPVMVTEVPPLSGPDVGWTFETVGGLTVPTGVALASLEDWVRTAPSAATTTKK